MTVTPVQEAIQPPAELRFKRKIRIASALKELWRSRELIRTLAERDLRARYKQALLGFAWALILPIVLMIVFSLFVRRVADVDTGGVPYPLFTYVALIPWTFFSAAVSQGGLSLVSNRSLLDKVYCPREVFPIAAIIVAAFDALVSTSLLLVLFAIFRFVPAATSFWIPVLMVIQLLFTLGFIFLISSILLYLRDLRHVLPMVLNLALFATPVAYRFSPGGNYRWLYAALNPLAPVIESYRRVVLYGHDPAWNELAVSAGAALVFFVLGYLAFKRLETGFADVA